jgi:excisionase family DNA binding protein
MTKPHAPLTALTHEDPSHPPKDGRIVTPPRLALSLDEAAASLGVSKDFFDEHVRPELRVARRGRRVLIAVAELERWLHTSAARALEG